MIYRLTWLNHWSTKQEAEDSRVIIRYTSDDDGWYEHEYILYFDSENDDTAKQYVREYTKKDETIEIFSLYNRQTKVTIFTEEDKEL